MSISRAKGLNSLCTLNIFPKFTFGYKHTFLNLNVSFIAQKYKKSSKTHIFTLRIIFFIILCIVDRAS